MIKLCTENESWRSEVHGCDNSLFPSDSVGVNLLKKSIFNSHTNILKFKGSLASTSSANSSQIDENELLDSVDSPFLEEFRLAAKQLADLAATASELDKEDEKSESDIIDSVEAFLLGWVPVEKNQMQIDPQGVLEVELKIHSI